MSVILKKLVPVIGMVVGVAIVIAGFCVRSVDSYSDSGTYVNTANVGQNIKFGADFYTEMYSVTKDVGNAVNNAPKEISEAANNATNHICGAVNHAVRAVCNAIGWLIISLGAVDICFVV